MMIGEAIGVTLKVQFSFVLSLVRYGNEEHSGPSSQWDVVFVQWQGLSRVITSNCSGLSRPCQDFQHRNSISAPRPGNRPGFLCDNAATWLVPCSPSPCSCCHVRSHSGRSLVREDPAAPRRGRAGSGEYTVTTKVLCGP